MALKIDEAWVNMKQSSNEESLPLKEENPTLVRVPRQAPMEPCICTSGQIIFIFPFGILILYSMKSTVIRIWF